MNSDFNPLGLVGIAFLEIAMPNPLMVEQKLEEMGFTKMASNAAHTLSFFQQGSIYLLANAETPKAKAFARKHGPGISAIGLRVNNAKDAFSLARKKGARARLNSGYSHLGIKSLAGVGSSSLLLLDFDIDTLIKKLGLEKQAGAPSKTINAKLNHIDHLTHNVQKGQMEKWVQFYETVFNFKEIRFFDIKGKLTGLQSRALKSPCGTFSIPINESQDKHSQIAEFIDDFKGEGIQHVAFSTEHIHHSVETLRQEGIDFLDTPDPYFAEIKKRVPWHEEDVVRLQKNKILIDGGLHQDQGLLLQIFTENIFGPVFFEIIQRKNNMGFGEGNFQALFEAIELDQMKRGVLQAL